MFLFILSASAIGFCVCYSNTSHVLIYRSTEPELVSNAENSNTSHVLIYRFSSPFAVMKLLFKYISCSYLSHFLGLEVGSIFVFKYISCSYLSSCLSKFSIFCSNSNTSHVLIYPLSFGNSTVNPLFKYISCSYLSGA